ncbi:hypothetical protein B7463_g2401, partial [Scytalidium lignicola]
MSVRACGRPGFWGWFGRQHAGRGPKRNMVAPSGGISQRSIPALSLLPAVEIREHNFFGVKKVGAGEGPKIYYADELKSPRYALGLVRPEFYDAPW